jgi:hypothetical protein
MQWEPTGLKLEHLRSRIFPQDLPAVQPKMASPQEQIQHLPQCELMALNCMSDVSCRKLKRETMNIIAIAVEYSQNVNYRL